MQRITGLTLLLILLTGCLHKDGTANNSALPDQLNTKWEQAWNQHDSSAIVSMFDKNVMMNAGQPFMGVDSMKLWVSHYLPRIANLSTKKVNVVQSPDMIVYTCTFKHDEIRKEAVAGISTGLCSFVYIKSNDGWKIRYIQMHEFQ